MGCDESLQLSDKRRVPPELELCVDPVLLRRDAQLVEPRGLEPGEVLLVEVRERRPAPEPERLRQQLARRAEVRVPCGREQPLEAVDVDASRGTASR